MLNSNYCKSSLSRISIPTVRKIADIPPLFFIMWLRVYKFFSVSLKLFTCLTDNPKTSKTNNTLHLSPNHSWRNKLNFTTPNSVKLRLSTLRPPSISNIRNMRNITSAPRLQSFPQGPRLLNGPNSTPPNFTELRPKGPKLNGPDSNSELQLQKLQTKKL